MPLREDKYFQTKSKNLRHEIFTLRIFFVGWNSKAKVVTEIEWTRLA